ncbi:MAG: ZIP family metal transporter [Leptothrix sp. (in: b-proteobacteria)]
MTLLSILIATFASGVLSVLLAGWLALPLLGRMLPHMVSLSTGVMLAAALLDVLPEAFTAGADPRALFATLLGGLMFFFLLEKAELYRHSHHHEGDDPHHHHHHGFDAEQAGRGGWSVLVGDATHNFCDGVLIGAAFLADPHLGWLTAIAVGMHEIPHELGAFIVLLNAGFTRRKALLFNTLSGTASVVGGVLSYFALAPFQGVLPYMLMVAASTLIYIAVADLIPQLQKRMSWRATLAQLAWLGSGIALIALMSHFEQSH